MFTPNDAELVSDSGSLINKAFNPFGRIFIRQSNLSLFDFSMDFIIEGSSSFEDLHRPPRGEDDGGGHQG